MYGQLCRGLYKGPGEAKQTLVAHILLERLVVHACVHASIYIIHTYKNICKHNTYIYIYT